MTEATWLRDQPASWHDVNRALKDISVLLQYLGELPDARLLGCFEDTRRGVPNAALPAAPPCPSYPQFLSVLSDISAAFQTGRADLLPKLSAADGRPAPTPVGFVFWSRDFLAAVAAPATADSIRLTRAYMVRRARCSRISAWLHGTQKAAPAEVAPLQPGDHHDDQRGLQARRLAHWVRFFEWLTVAGVALTVMISIYALSGRLILGNEQSTQDAWLKMDAALQQQEEKIFAPPVLPVTDRTALPVVALCDLRQAGSVQPALTEIAGPAGLRMEAVAGPTHYISAQQVHLCAQRDQVLRNLFVVTMHLQTWSSVVTQVMGEDLHLPIAPLFGVTRSTIADYAHESEGGLCQVVAPEMMQNQSGSDACARVLRTLINRSRNVADSILSSITHYILPVCYGFLGAMAAGLRRFRRKVDASLLSFTDRGRLPQDAILGVLCGGIIGLFGAYLGAADAAGGLSLPALALLAGYNADGVFRFLDELSDRLFRPAQSAQAHAK